MKRIYVTGSQGFTGLHLAPYLKENGYEVLRAQANLLDAAALTSEVHALQPTHVLHLAAIAFVAHADAEAMYLTNILGTRHLLEALKPVKGLQKVLLASSAHVYGNSEASPLPEQQPPAPANDYAVSKLAMEHLARLYLPALPVVLARPFNYTGPGQSADFLIPKLVNAYKRRDARIELGNLDVFREFNDVRLICAAYALLLAHGQAGSVVNVCSGQAHALRDVLALLTELTGHKPEVFVNPAFVRANELTRLCGDPAALQTLAAANLDALPSHTLQETLRWMLGA